MVLALGEAVDAALLCSWELVKKCLARSSEDVVTRANENTCTVDNWGMVESTMHRQDEVAVKSKTAEQAVHKEGGLAQEQIAVSMMATATTSRSARRLEVRNLMPGGSGKRPRQENVPWRR